MLSPDGAFDTNASSFSLGCTLATFQTSTVVEDGKWEGEETESSEREILY